MSALLLFIPALAAPFLAALIGVYLVHTHNLKGAGQYKFYALTFPSELDMDPILDWYASVSSSLSREQSIVLELWSDKHGLTHRLGIPWQRTELLTQLRTQVSGIHIEEHARGSIPTWTHAIEAGVSDKAIQFNLNNPAGRIRSILAASTADMKPDDVLVTQLVIAPVTRLHGLVDVERLLGFKREPNKPDPDKRDQPKLNNFRAVLRVAAFSDTKPHAKKLVSNVRASFNDSANHAIYFTDRWFVPRKDVIGRLNRAAGQLIYPGQLNSLELATFSAWPVGSPAIPGLTVGKTRYLPPNETIAREGRKLGNSVYESFRNRPVAMTEEGGTRHVYAIGPSGRGKSALLNNMAQQDIEAGHGVIVIDAKGDQFYPLLDAIPKERVNDVIVLDFTDGAHPVGFNVLKEGVVDDIYSMFLHSSPESIYLKDVLHHALHAFSYFPELTVVDVLPFVDAQTPLEKAWRDGLIDRMPKNSAYRQYWQSFFARTDKEQRERVKPLANRMWELTSRRDVRNFLGQSNSTFNLKEVLTGNKIMLVYLPENLGAPTVSLIGSLLVGNIWSSVRAVRDEKKSPTYLYMDEVQKFLNLPIDLPDMLSLARSYQLGLVMAHQYIDQLPRELYSAVTNASTKVAFKLDGPDAGRIQTLFGKAVTADDFMALDPFQALVRVATPGGSSEPTVIKTYPPFKPHGLSKKVREASRAQFSRKASDVDAEILRRRVAPSKSEAKRERTFGSRVKEAGDE